MDNSERREALGKAISQERRRQGISQRKLAQMLGLSTHSYLVEIEHGTRNVGFDTICAISDALDVKVSYFFTKF